MMLTLVYNPAQKLGMTLNMDTGVVESMMRWCPFAKKIAVGAKITAVNGQAYTPRLFSHLLRRGINMTITFALPETQTSKLQVPAPQNARSRNGQARQRRRSTSSSGSTSRQICDSHSRTPERMLPVQVVPDLNKAVKITSVNTLDATTLAQTMRIAGVFPQDVKLVNQFCAYATFDSTFSAMLASRTYLGRALKVQLAQENRV